MNRLIRDQARRVKRAIQKQEVLKSKVFFVIAFACLGVIFLAISRAASPNAVIEPESGVVSGVASVVADGSASGGAAVRFGGGGQTQTPTMTATLNATTTFQTITGLGVNINANAWDNGKLKPALDMLIDQNGSKTFRVVIEMTDWEATNDDADPNNYNWSYYDPIYAGTTSFNTSLIGANFSNLWNTIDYLHQKGIPDSGIILSLMGDAPTWMGGDTLGSGKLDEWAETVTSAAYYGYTHGHTFGIFSPNNEEDAGGNEGVRMTAAEYADGMNRIAIRLNALGLSGVRLLGPETCCVATSTFVTPMKAFPTLMAKLDHFDFHNYGLGTGNASGAISGTGKDFWMSEYAYYHESFVKLGEGAAGLLMWDGFDSAYNHAVLNGRGRNPPNDGSDSGPSLLSYNTSTKIYTPRKEFYQFGQMFRYTQLGMRRVQISSSENNMDLVAFVHPTSGAITIVGQNNTGSTQVIKVTLQNAPAATVFHVTRTNSSSNMTLGSDAPVTNGAVTVSVPNATDFTLTTL